MSPQSTPGATRGATPEITRSAGSRRILLAVSAGIAAYKIPDLVRELVRLGHQVRCIMTPDARRFVSPLVLQALTGRPVGTDLFASAAGSGIASVAGAEIASVAGTGIASVTGAEIASVAGGEIDHIAIADWAEAVVVAPATANLLARMRAGFGDDLVA